jgi:hypothetical protein
MQKLTKQAYKDIEKRNEAKKLQTELLLPKIPKISQSLIKALHKYKMEEECGLKIHASYVEGINFPSSEVQELGNYFEYICTNQLPRDGHTPEPKLLKTGKMSIDYERLTLQKENFINVMKRMNFTIEKTGFSFTNPLYSGIADIIALDNNIKSKVVTNKRIIIDIKTSGLLNDKWNAYGWADESIEEKWDLTIQAIHYKMLAKWEWGIEDIPFYFFVFSNKNEWEYKIFEVIVDEDTKQQHLNNLKNIKVYLDEQMKNGFKAVAEYRRCKECPMSDTCPSYVDIPSVKKVYI